jgi:hypothetical protein
MNVNLDKFIETCDSMMIPQYENQLECALESKLTKIDRDKLPDSAFGLPKQRKYPLIITKVEDRTAEDKDGGAHIRNAIAFFHFCKEQDRKELASNIMKAIKKNKLNIKIDEKNMIRKYINVEAA